jgi:hypothetical protein
MEKDLTSPAVRVNPAVWLAAALLVLALAQALAWEPTEPFYNNDENRHVMTGVFFRDLLLEMPLDGLRGYTTGYYLQYPALGLMVWPPLFYGVEGLFMLLFGTSYFSARALIALFSTGAFAYLFLLVRRTHETFDAALTVLLFGLAPLVFLLSRHVMLEMPAVFFALAAVYHFLRYLDAGRRLDVYVAGVASALFALTRFDGHFLLLFFLIVLVWRRRFDVLRHGHVWLAALLALGLVVPVYVPLMMEFGHAHVLMTVKGGANAQEFAARTPWYYLSYYPRDLLRQIGPFTVVPAVLGFFAALLRPSRRAACWPYLALAAATYLAFTFLAEVEERHSIYWYPAFALFAMEGIRLAAGWIPAPRARAALAVFVAAGSFWSAATRPVLYVRGYEDAARYVLANTGSSRFVLIDGFLNGDFIYQVRRLDPGKKLWVLRGDKILYSVLISPRGGYREYAGGRREILDKLYRYDPELIVVEQPQVGFRIPMAEQLRQTLAAHPERYELVKSFPVESNVPIFRNVRLDVYRSKVRNPEPETRVAFDMIGLGREIGTEVAKAESSSSR